MGGRRIKSTKTRKTTPKVFSQVGKFKSKAEKAEYKQASNVVKNLWYCWPGGDVLIKGNFAIRKLKKKNTFAIIRVEDARKLKNVRIIELD